MAYRRRTSRRSGGSFRSSFRRSKRTTVRRGRYNRRSAGGGKVVRIVIEQPRPATDVAAVVGSDGIMLPGAPTMRRSRF